MQNFQLFLCLVHHTLVDCCDPHLRRALGGSSALYSDIIQQLEVSVEVEDDSAADEAESDITASDGAIMIHLYPGDFPNLTTAMKSIVTGFIDQSTDSGRGYNDPPAHLVTYRLSLYASQRMA